MFTIFHSYCIRISRKFRWIFVFFVDSSELSDSELVSSLDRPTTSLRPITIGTLMSLVALVAVLLWWLVGITAEAQRSKQGRRHEGLAVVANFSLLFWERESERNRKLLEKSRHSQLLTADGQSRSTRSSAHFELEEYQQKLDFMIQSCRTKGRFHEEMREKYRQAARNRWSQVTPDPPEPPEPRFPRTSY